MSSLWTPGGEHEVPPQAPEPAPAPQPAASTAPSEPSAAAEIPGFDDLTPEQQAQAEQMAHELAEARERIAETPAAEVVANHVMGLYELAAIHLGAGSVAEAKVGIDAMAGRLGENEAVLREALQQVQMAFVQVSQATDEPDPAP